MEEKNELESFFDGLPSEDKPGENLFDKLTEEVKSQEDDEPHKNRRHRRLEAQLTEEREARIAAEARAQALSETPRFREDTQDISVDQRWLQMYGDSPASRTAWKLQQEMFDDYTARAKDEALKQIKEEQRQEQVQQKEFESFIDSQLETIEDEFNVDVTSDAPAARKARREFLEMVQKISPKDEQGNISAYSDFGATWEAYQLKRSTEKNPGTTERQKEIASRSMRKSGGVDVQQANDDSTIRFLRDQGIRI